MGVAMSFYPQRGGREGGRKVRRRSPYSFGGEAPGAIDDVPGEGGSAGGRSGRGDGGLIVRVCVCVFCGREGDGHVGGVGAGRHVEFRDRAGDASRARPHHEPAVFSERPPPRFGRKVTGRGGGGGGGGGERGD